MPKMERKTHFKRIPLREFAELMRREVKIEPTKTYRTLGCRLYGQGVYQREVKMGIQIRAEKMFLVKENDFVINRIWAQKGSAGIVPPEISGSVVTQDFPVFELDITEVLPSYIAWYVRTKDFREECKKHSHGTSGRQRLSPKELPNITFPLCGLTEQKQIVSKIEKVDQLKKLLDNRTEQEMEILIFSILEKAFKRKT
jgi:type I restriction enzyme S subunit